ncbi:hypothetical protein M1523_03990 [Patescibacteria group bacterium]|nr:hypothetical protein [Patescibacteria group bacterium]MCL5091852.1 hypothetical protein [Patescibacteria group bacterium]
MTSIKKIIRFVKTHTHISILVVFTFIYLLQIRATYIDYNENHYLYIAWRLLNGEIPYRDFLVPHPPVLYIVGFLLLRLYDSVFTVRVFLLAIFIVGAHLFYLLTLRIFKKKSLATTSLLLYFILPISLMVWKTFIQESLLRLVGLMILLMIVPVKRLDEKKVTLVAVLSVVGIFTKYSFVPFVIMMAVLLWLVNKRYLFRYGLITLSLSVGLVLLLQLGTRGNFLYDTVIIRKYIHLKPIIKTSQLIAYMIITYGLLYLINLISIVKYRINRNLDLFICSLVPLLYAPFLLILLVDGTYGYIVYPIEPLILLIPVYLFDRFFVAKAEKLDLFSYLILILSSTVLIYYVQCFIFVLPMVTTDVYRNYNERVKTLVNRYAKDTDEILSTPHINNYLLNKKILNNFSETFLWSYEYNYGEKRAQGTINSTIDAINARALPLIVLDENLEKILPLFNAVKRSYIEINGIAHSSVHFFIPMRCSENNGISIGNDAFFGMGFSAADHGGRRVDSQSEFYFCNQRFNQINIDYQTDAALVYPLEVRLVCDGKSVHRSTVVSEVPHHLIAIITDLYSSRIVKCNLEFINAYYNNSSNEDTDFAVISRISLVK